MANAAEQAFLRVYINTLVSQPVTYTDDYQQPPANCLRKVPVLHVSLPPPPPKKQSSAASSEPLTLTFKSLKPPVSYTIVVHLTDTIAAVKARLAGQPSGPPVETQRLLLKGKALADAKLLKEYSIKDGDTVNLALKTLPTTPPMATESAPAAQPPSIHLASPTPTQPRKHQRIPSVVLSPSPSSETSGAGSGGDIMLTLDAATESLPASELSSYHATIAQPEYWERLLAYLRSEFKNDADAQVAFEDYLRASKGSLTAHEIAKIRDHVGVIGMAGT